ncbi:hypothetical protein DPMN_054637 [Dreissena polymorpha]|uniref:Uncharacterized protein n=1 Tax=Dreissena polymorpha TaxID=45954 RepID=A0A9D4CQ90_DREPO|nr:hypothetical protein DPMN_054637 [Dreissena polymorpha]
MCIIARDATVRSHVSRQRNARPAGRSTRHPLGSCAIREATDFQQPLRELPRRLVVPDGRTRIWLALYKRPMFLLSNTDQRLSATTREIRHPPLRRDSPAEYAGSARRDRQSVCDRRQRHTDPWVPRPPGDQTGETTPTISKSRLQLPFARAPRKSDQRSGLASL